MKIIDKTPYQDEKGQIGLLERIQGTLKYGFSWFGELEAQKGVIAQLERALERGFVLIRNFTLPGSEIVLPMILIGPPGVYVIHVTPLTGFFEAKGDQWSIVKNGRASPAPINLMSRVARLARALHMYLERQGVTLPGPQGIVLVNPVEPVLIASSPAMHVESMRPAVRVVMSDAIRQFAASLLQARPGLRAEQVHDLADRIITPRPKPEAGAAPGASGEASAAARAQAIFKASEEAQPINPNDLGFSFEEEPAANAVPAGLRETSPARPLSSPAGGRRIFGLTNRQITILAGIFTLWLCILAAGLITYIALNS
jgi:hypothetical protein